MFLELWFRFLVASTVLFTWYDDKGNLHVTDRLADVPQKYRAAFAKQLEESQKKKPKPVPAAESAPTAEQGDAYQRYLARVALEKATRARADKLRQGIGDARDKMASLDEEYGNLASNPVLNAAQPIRHERMEEIQAELAKAQVKIDTNLDELRQMLMDSKDQNIPENWVTGL